MISLRQLSHALALQEHRNFGKAATACNISQSAFSRSIQSLEDALGATLFDRLSNRVEPTVFGNSVLAKAAVIGIELEELVREVSLLKGLESGLLRVAMGSNAAEISGNAAVSMLMAERPGLNLQVRGLSWLDVVDQVINRNVDIGFAEISGATDDNRLQVESVSRRPLFFVCRRQHPLASRKKLAVADLDAYKMVVPRVPQRAASLLPGRGNALSDTGELIPSIEVDNYLLISQIIRQSDAFTLATRVQVEAWRRPADFHLLPIQKPWLHLDYGFITLRDRAPSPATERFRQIVTELEAGLQ